jgi:DNA-binding MarR family transcriptional regulator
MDAPNVHGLVLRLIKRGFVSRVRDASDPRRMRLSLTPEGETIAVSLPERARASEEATLAALSPRDRAVLVGLLQRLLDAPDAGGALEIKSASGLNRSFT